MQIARGRTRTILIFDFFVIKLPRIYFWRAIKAIGHGLQYGALMKYLRYDIDTYNSPRRFLFKGIRDNWQEFLFYRRNRLPILAPTWFSLFGLLNIQKKIEMVKIKETTLWCQLCAMTSNEVWSDSHTFSNAVNFSNVGGKLIMVDYGDPAAHPVLEKFGDKIFNEFDFNYEYASGKAQS
jgi:hypothetical protein